MIASPKPLEIESKVQTTEPESASTVDIKRVDQAAPDETLYLIGRPN
jgi:hypothetical protein